MPPEAAPRRGPVRFLSWLAGRPAALGRRLRPAPRTRKAMAWASCLLALAVGGALGSRIDSGEGLLIDVAAGVVIAGLALLLVPVALGLVLLAYRLLSGTFGLFGLAGLIALFAVLDLGAFSRPDALVWTLVLGLSTLLLAGALAALTGPPGHWRILGRTTAAVLGLVGAAGLGGTVWYALDPGSGEHLRPVATPDAAPPPALDAADPSRPGPHAVRTATYGSGDDRRPGFGDEVPGDLVTSSVDGRPFVDWPDGWRGALRTRYWGFDAAELPRNGRVWYPDGDGPFPLVLMVHGNHHMAEFSDPGYAYLGRLLASRGHVAVSVDENFLNGSIAGGGMRGENDGRGWLLLEHLEQWRIWNGTAGHRFAGLVDLDRVVLIGHSRGGEAVCHAAVFNRLARHPDDAAITFDYGFGIRGLVCIAPVDGQYRPAGRDAVVEDVSLLVVHGGHDADVRRFHGDRIYRRARLAEEGDAFKASLWIHRANHGQFNTVWGSWNTGPPRAWLLNHAALMPGEDQRRIAEVYIGAFLAAVVGGEPGYRELFRHPRAGRSWLPGDATLVARYEEPGLRTIADFEEDVDVTTTTLAGGHITAEGFAVWREGDVPLRRGGERRAGGVFLGWNQEPAPPPGEQVEGAVEAVADRGSVGTTGGPRGAAFAVHLPRGDAGVPVGGDSVLVLELAASDEEPEAPDYGDDGTDEDEADGEQNDEETEEDDDTDPATPLDLTVELVTTDGIRARLPLSRFGVLPPPLEVQVRRPLPWGEGGTSFEPVVQTFHLPLSAFVEQHPDFRPAALQSVRLVFDRSPEGMVIVDRIALAAASR